MPGECARTHHKGALGVVGLDAGEDGQGEARREDLLQDHAAHRGEQRRRLGDGRLLGRGQRRASGEEAAQTSAEPLPDLSPDQDVQHEVLQALQHP